MKKLMTCLLVVTLFMACKKSDDNDTPAAPAPTPTAAGYWKGSETYTGTNYRNAFVLNADGTLKFYFNYNVDTATALIRARTGKYELLNSKFKAIIYEANSTAVRFSYEGTINSSLTKVENGTWGDYNSVSNGGTFYMDKQ
jgi:hypothetical protein